MKLSLPDWGTLVVPDTTVLSAGAIGVDQATRIVKIGDGIKTWAQLPSFGAAATLPIFNTLTEAAGLAVGTAFAVKGVAQSPVAVAQNLETNPKMLSGGTFAQAGGTTTFVSDWLTNAVRFTSTGSGSMRLSFFGHSLTANGTYSMRLKLRSSVAQAISIRYRPVTSSNATGETPILTAYALPAGESEVVIDGFTLGATQGSPGSFAITWTGAAAGETLDLTDVLIEQKAVSTPFFYYGGSSLAAPYAVAWDGAANASTSTLTRTPYAATLYIA